MSESQPRPAQDNVPPRLRVVMAQLDFLVGDIPGNTRAVIDAAKKAGDEHGADVVVATEP
mgnify:CR=1 FL=1